MPQPAPFRILVLCAGNRARSQMAHGWLRCLGGERVAVESAGTAPKGLHPLSVRVMAEVGIDISAHSSDHVDQYVAQDFDLALTVCDSAREKCPVFPARSGCCTGASRTRTSRSWTRTSCWRCSAGCGTRLASTAASCWTRCIVT